MINEKQCDVYLGWKAWNPTDEELAEFYVTPKEPFPLIENEYLLIYNEDKLIDAYCKEGDHLRRFRHNSIKVKDKTIVLNDDEINVRIDEIGKQLEGNGRILVRPSGTEPLIRVMVEAENDDICRKHVYEVIDLIKEKGYAA